MAGAFFYAACNSTQIMVRGLYAISTASYATSLMLSSQVFSNLAIQSKRKAPNAHTFLEILRVRYGTFVHLSFMFFSLAANTVCQSDHHISSESSPVFTACRLVRPPRWCGCHQRTHGHEQ